MIPLRDLNPTRRFPVVTIALIAINVLIFILELSLSPEEQNQLSCMAGLIPCQVTGSCPDLTQRFLPQYTCLLFATSGPPVALDFITAMFLHGGLLHLLSNMLYLWIFGNNIEDVLGRGPFILFYLACGIAASFAQILAEPSAPIPTIGASGAIAGILGAYLILFPHTRILSVVFLFYFIRFIEIPAIIVLGFWFVLQFFNGLASLGLPAMGGVAYFAHIGGFVAGVVLIYLFRRFQKPRPPRRQTPYRRNLFQDEFPDLWE
jgi:membrane associated rhomboid family serine protease